jgi:radical SAM superfamily enzyme YgiQ (UPF0313 family)
MRVLLVVYDNESYIHWFPQGIAYIAAVLERNGHEVEIYHQDYHHYSEEHLTSHIDASYYDMVGFSFIGGYYQYRKALKISSAVNDSKRRPFYVIGGHGPAPEPEFFLRKTGADVVVIGEGEETILEILDSVSERSKLDKVRGIAFRKGDKIVVNERRTLIKDVDSIPFPAYHMFPMHYYRLLRMPHCTSRDFVMPLLSGRGCPFKCNFCYRMDEGFRPRSNGSLIEEIQMLKKDYGISYIAFSDELMVSSEERIKGLCEDFIKADLGIRWDCNGRLNYAKSAILSLMKRAGCVFINYGIEAMDDTILKNMDKCLNTEQITKGIEATLKVGISPGFNIIFGNIGENKETLRKGVEFLLKYDDGSQMRTIRPVTPYPGCPLYYHAIEKGLLKDVEDFYEKKHVNSDLLSVNFTDLTDDEFHLALMDANRILINNYQQKKAEAIEKQLYDLYVRKNTSFRGFRQS